jgi:hypothetical protein
LAVALTVASAFALGAPPVKDKTVPTLRWAESHPGCTFSLDPDGKYRYALWSDDYGVILAVDAQELEKVHRRVEPFFSVEVTVRYRGKSTLDLNPGAATLQFVRHSKIVQSSLDPEGFATTTQNDADELEHQTQREIEKHPERKEEREKYVQAYQKDVVEFLEFLAKRTLPPAQLNQEFSEVNGWILFSTKSKWIGDWKKPEQFLLRLPVGKEIVEFPFALPAEKGDLVLRRR